MPGVPLAPNEGDGNIRDRTEREFEVVVHLGKEPGSFSPEVVDLGTDPTSGRSLIKIPRNTSLGFETSFGKIEAIENGHEEMAAFAFRCLAAGWPDALRKYSEMVAPIIDQMAFANDVPIFVRSIAWKDAANRTWGASYTAPYRHVVPGGEVQFEHELRPLYALYREALSSGSVFYQFLCLSKILEGSFRSILPKLRAEAKARGLPTPKVDDKVDPSEHIHGGARQWIGHGIEQTPSLPT